MRSGVDAFCRPDPQFDGFAQVRDLSKLGALQRHPQTGFVCQLPSMADGVAIPSANRRDRPYRIIPANHDHQRR